MRNPFSRDAFGQGPDMSAYNVGQGQTGAGAVSPDERVRTALQAAGYGNPLVTEAHNFTVALNCADGRTQQIYIASQTQTVRGREWRRVYSWSYDAAGGLSLEQASALLDEAKTPVLGSWFTSQGDERVWVGFQIMVPADCPPEELDAAIYEVAWEADVMERASVGTDYQ
jgi:hypothetical protein